MIPTNPELKMAVEVLKHDLAYEDLTVDGRRVATTLLSLATAKIEGRLVELPKEGMIMVDKSAVGFVKDAIKGGYKQVGKINEERLIKVMDKFFGNIRPHQSCQFVDLPDGYNGISVRFTKYDLAKAIITEIGGSR